MCGIFGYLLTGGSVENDLPRERLAELEDLVSRRGPDDRGVWSDGKACWLGFRRLSVIDPSPEANQPMRTGNDRYALVLNGEIYNFRQLRTRLEATGCRFRTRGDCEVALQALITWGPSALQRFNGMFALAFYDAAAQRLLVARDHAGIKPLYLLRDHRGVFFGSRFDQVARCGWASGRSVRPQSAALYYRLGFLPSPYALLEGTAQVEAGQWIEFSRDGSERTSRFFEFPRSTTPDLCGQDAIVLLDEVLGNAVERQLIADVGVGTFLSGGVDSPLVSAMASERAGGPLPAFTLGGGGEAHDEAPDAKAYAQALRLPQAVEYASSDGLVELVFDSIRASGEPFGDFSILPTLQICHRASQDVKVVLSGDGGDELFWGYPGRFSSVLEIAEQFGQPFWMRSMKRALSRFGLGRASSNLRYRSIGDWYQAKHSHLQQPTLDLVLPGLPAWPNDFAKFQFDGHDTDQVANWLRWNEYTVHLERVLAKVDRASMHHSLEVRVPLLDLEVIEVASRVAWQDCLSPSSGIGKLPLRALLSARTSHRTGSKRGFGVPLAQWLRGPLEEVFRDSVLSKADLLGVPVKRTALAAFYDEHHQGQRDHAWGLWTLMSAALWDDYSGPTPGRRC